MKVYTVVIQRLARIRTVIEMYQILQHSQNTIFYPNILVFSDIGFVFLFLIDLYFVVFFRAHADLLSFLMPYYVINLKNQNLLYKKEIPGCKFK